MWSLQAASGLSFPDREPHWDQQFIQIIQTIHSAFGTQQTHPYHVWLRYEFRWTKDNMEEVMQILSILTQFYDQLPQQPPKPELSQLSRMRVRNFFLNLIVRCPELYNNLSQPIPDQ